MLTYAGAINLGVLSPLTLTVVGTLAAEVAADVTALTSLAVSVGITPPTIAASIDVVVNLVAGLALAIEFPPASVYVDFQATIMLGVIAELELTLALPLSLNALLGGDGGIFAYGYEGSGADFGATVSGEWPDNTPSTAESNALIVATVTPSVWTDVGTFFGVLPPSLPPGLTYLASVNIGLLCPLVVSATGPIIADLQARLAGAIALAARLAIQLPTILTSVAGVAALLLSLEAALTAGLPGLAFQFQAIASALASLEAKLSLLALLTLSMSGGGAYVYTYAGAGADLGPALTSELATQWPDGTPSSGPANALLMGVTSPVVWGTVSTFFGAI